LQLKTTDDLFDDTMPGKDIVPSEAETFQGLSKPGTSDAHVGLKVAKARMLTAA